MKNKIAVAAVIISIVIVMALNLYKIVTPIKVTSPGIALILSFQMLAVCAAFTIVLFVVFSYSWLTYLISFFTYTALVVCVYRIFLYPKVFYSDNINRFLTYCVALLLTFLTFYILKKLKVNMAKK